MYLLTRDKCFEVGWQLLRPDTWEYRDIFTGDKGIATIEGLQTALKAKLNRLKPKDAVATVKTSAKRKK